MSNDQKSKEVAERMTRTIGLPISSVNNLIGEFSDDDIERLSGLGDDEFKQESVKLVNKAQQRQFANIGKSLAEDTAVVTAKITSEGAPGSEKKKLVIPIAGSGDASAAPTASAETTPKPKISIPQAESPTESQTMMPPPGGNPNPKAKKLQINMKAAEENKGSSDAAAKVMADAVAAAPPPAPMPENEKVPTASPAEDDNRGAPQASGIKAVEPEGRKPLNISAQEAEKIEGEVPKHIRTADLPDDGETRDVSSAFNKLEDNSKDRGKKMLPLLVGGGIAAVFVIGLLGYLAYTMVFGSGEPVAITPPPNSTQPPVNPTPIVPVVPKKVIGKWAWKHTKSFEESFENPYVLREKESAFTVEMWISIEAESGVEAMSLTTVNKDFILGMKKYRNKPMLYFDVPEAYSGKGGVKSIMPNSRGWIHVAGVYDPTDSHSLTLFINGHKSGTRTCKKEAPRLVASIFIINGVVGGEKSAILIDDIRMSDSAIYTEDFTPVRNMEQEKTTTALLRMEQNKVGATFEIKDAAQEKVKPYLFTVGDWVEVDTVDFKLAVDRIAELEKEMFSWMKRKWSAEKYDKFKADWVKLPSSQKQKIRETFEGQLEREKNKPKPTPNGS